LAAIDSVRGTLPNLREVIRIADFDAVADSARGDTPLPHVAPQDPCVIMFTSGTTGEQKAAIFHHKGVINMSLFTEERGGLAVGGVFINPMPMFHIGALGHAGVGAVMRRATHVLAAEWDAKLFMSLVAREGGQYSLLVPTMIEAMLAHPERHAFDLSTLKNLVSGASVVEASLIRRAHAELCCTICNIFGQTEMQGVVSGVHRDDDARDQAETIGQPMAHVEVRIADPATGAVMPLDETGEIQVRGYQTMIGYFNLPEETTKTLLPDGWLRSGDLGSMDSRGFLKITGRIKDMIIRGGENVYPREIENLLLEPREWRWRQLLECPTHFGARRSAQRSCRSPEKTLPRPASCMNFAARASPPTKHRASGISWIRFHSRRPGSCRNSSSCRRLTHGAWRRRRRLNHAVLSSAHLRLESARAMESIRWDLTHGAGPGQVVSGRAAPRRLPYRGRVPLLT
jgi:acyl-CoA synthetase (AMP-forming)/AMP-acid ligase II